MTLVNGAEAAKQMGVSRWFISSLKRAGAPFWGNKTCIKKLEDWLDKHPEFVAKRAWDKE